MAALHRVWPVALFADDRPKSIPIRVAAAQKTGAA
jgi:hypothetical protein